MARVDGVGDVFLFGQQDYSMRIWVDPDQLASLNLTAGDVVDAVQRAEHAGGGRPDRPAARRPRASRSSSRSPPSAGSPSRSSSRTSSSAPAPTAARSASRTSAASSWAPRTRTSPARSTATPSTSLAIFQLPDANALATADRIRDKMEELKKTFPDDVDYEIAYDTTPFIAESINEVVQHAGRGHRPRGHRRAGLPAELALDADPAGRRCRWPSSAPSPSWRPSASA